VAAHAEGNCLVLDFDQKERLFVWHPRAARISATEFSIFNASKVRWEWYYYSRPATPGNLMTDEFDFNGGEIMFSSTFPQRVSEKANPHAPAVIIH
jgi:hypothetical protein